VAGVFAPAILKDDPALSSSEIAEGDWMKNMVKTTDSCILYGVPKVEYSFEECTPFPASLRPA
jgi:hypothetical protein